MTLELWEILVPFYDADGNRIVGEVHVEWGQKIKTITGEVMMTTTPDKIFIENGNLFQEMSPVRFVAYNHQIDQILRTTMEFYNLQDVIAYMLYPNVRTMKKVVH